MIPTRKMPSSFNYGKMTAGVGPKFQRFTGSGTINSGMANTIGGMKSGIDALRSGMPLYDAGSFNSYTPGRPSSQPIGLQYGFAGNEQESEAAQGVWNLTNSPQLQKDNYLYGRPDTSRFEDGMSLMDYFDSKGAHKYTDVMNDPANIGKLTAGDIGLMASGAGLMGGMMMLPGGVLASGAGAGGAAGSGAGFVGEGAASGVPLWDQAIGGSILNAGLEGGAAAGGGLLESIGLGGLAETLSGLPAPVKFLGGKALSGALGGALGGGGRGGGRGPGIGDLLNIIGGGIDARNQGKAADALKDYIGGNLDYLKGLYNPGSPEHNLMKQELERKDAAAGRNSQYGQRAVELAAKLAGVKGDLVGRYVPGTSRALADAWETDAGRYAGLSAALGKSFGGSGGGFDLGGIFDLISGGGFGGGLGGDVQMPTDDWYTNPTDWTETDVMDWMFGDSDFDWLGF